MKYKTKKSTAKAAQRSTSMAAVQAGKKGVETFYHNAAGGLNVHTGGSPWRNADGDATPTDTGSSATVPPVDATPADATATAAPASTPATGGPCKCMSENHKAMAFGAGIVVGIVVALLVASRGSGE